MSYQFKSLWYICDIFNRWFNSRPVVRVLRFVGFNQTPPLSAGNRKQWIKITESLITRCGLSAPNHGLCGSNKLLYKRCAKLMERPKFWPPTDPTFSNRSFWKSKPRKISRIWLRMQNLFDSVRQEGGLWN